MSAVLLWLQAIVLVAFVVALTYREVLLVGERPVPPALHWRGWLSPAALAATAVVVARAVDLLT